jgi:hypothetical protein
MFEDRKYVIVPFADVTAQMISDCMETSTETLVHSTSGVDRVFLKYEGSTPSSLTGIDTYTHSQILNILHTDPEWATEEPV